MASNNHIQNLIAHYLKENNLNSTLRAFELELNKKFSPEIDESLKSIINDRINFQQLNNELSDDLDDLETKIYTPQNLQLIKSENIKIPNWSILKPDTKSSLHLGNLKTLIIHASYNKLLVDGNLHNVGLFVTNDKKLFLYNLDTESLLLKKENLHNTIANKLTISIPNTNIVLSCSMNGQLLITKLIKTEDEEYDLEVVSQHQLHKRLITSIEYLQVSNSEGFLCSIGWDLKLNVHHLTIMDSTVTCRQIDDYKLMTNGSCLAAFIEPELQLPVVLVGRLDTSMISTFVIHGLKLLEISKISLNDSEFSNHSFQPMSIVNLSDSLFTISTNHIPFMRLITIKFPKITDILSNYDTPIKSLKTVNEQLVELSKTHKNEQLFQSNVPILRSLIVSNLNSLSPQDKFSTPIVLRRPSPKQGLWIFSDDGIIRGFDLSTGNVIEELATHEGRIKSGLVGVINDDKEVIVTCGAVDREVFIWQ